MSAISPIILAVDTPDLSIAREWIQATHDYVGVYKLGLEFFLTFGASGVKELQSEFGVEIFLDLKLHDIPNTVAHAAHAVSSIAPKFLTVHASGGTEMVAAAVEALPAVDITAVTILTSLSEEELFKIGYANPALESAVALAKLATEAGARAIVCSPLEISAIRSAIGDSAAIITPGVRPAGVHSSDDQVRVMTPEAAISAGADFVVIGRPITGQWKNGAAAMSQAAEKILESIRSV